MVSRDVLALVLLAALWGGSFLFMRVAAPVLGPVPLIAIRVGLAALALALLGRQRIRFRQPPDHYLPPWGFRSVTHLLLLGLVNAALPFSLIAYAETVLPASLASILNALTPLLTASLSALWNREPIHPRQRLGLPLGVLGVGVLAGWGPLPLTPVVGLAMAASLSGALSYAVGAVYAARQFRGAPPLTLAFWQQATAFLWLAGPALLGPPRSWGGVPVAASVLALALLSTSLAYLLYFHLLRSIGPTRTMTVTFLVPLFGVLWGHLFLREPVTPVMLAGLALILGSVTLTTSRSP